MTLFLANDLTCKDQVWKRVWKMTFFGSEIVSGFEKSGGRLLLIPTNTPPPGFFEH